MKGRIVYMIMALAAIAMVVGVFLLSFYLFGSIGEGVPPQ